MPETTIGPAKYYITVFWGKSKGRILTYVIGCDHYEQALRIKSKADSRPEMIYVNITTTKPSYSPKKHHTLYDHFSDLGSIWTGTIPIRVTDGY